MTDSFNYAALIVARESRGRTQEEVARAVGISQGLISKAENGLRPTSTRKRSQSTLIILSRFCMSQNRS
jgi:transcriptional regulator with XRE-family HTH domain